MTIAQEHRIPRESIKKIVKSGRRFRSGPITAVFLENGRNASRIAVVISSKIVKKSTERNRIRRRAKEIFRKADKLFSKNCDIIVMFYSGSPFKFRDIEEILFEIFTKAKII